MKSAHPSLQILAISHYVLARIQEHYELYTGTQNQIDEQKRVLFHCFYFATTYQLSKGNTLLWLKQNNSEIGQGGNLILDSMFDVISSAIDGSDDSHYSLIASLPAIPKESLQSVVDGHIQATATKAQSAGLNKNDCMQVEQLLRLALQFAYVYYVTMKGNLAIMYETLKQSHFFIASCKQINNPLAFVLSDYQNKEFGQNEEFGVWLYRSWLSELRLSEHITRLLSADCAHITANPSLLAKLNDEQKHAVITSLNAQFTIITGGPGTGKTYTVAKIVTSLLANNPALSIALSAPTGKAAQRLGESLQKEMGNQAAIFDTTTIHRLLGMGIDGVPRYHTDNPLAYDVIIVDEASMLGVELSFKLVSSIKTGAKLILLGDAYQLSAVEAGAVLADLCSIPALKNHHQVLIESRRFDSHSGIGMLANKVNQKSQHIEYHDIASLIANHKELSLTDIGQLADYAKIISPYKDYFEKSHQTKLLLKNEQDSSVRHNLIQQLFISLNCYRILTASHQGAFGDIKINQLVNQAYFRQTFYKKSLIWYHGRAIMITKNTYELGLYNGDMGICIKEKGVFMVYFDGNPKAVPASILPEDRVVDAFAITIHKSQGSEFDHVAICFDETTERLLSKELIYTAITRAKKQVSIYTTKSALTHAVNTPTIRQTGLSLLFE